VSARGRNARVVGGLEVELGPGDPRFAALGRLERSPFLTKRQVERWKVATTRLFVEGEIRRPGG
jgi:hypothetical protein